LPRESCGRNLARFTRGKAAALIEITAAMIQAAAAKLELLAGLRTSTARRWARLILAAALAADQPPPAPRQQRRWPPELIRLWLR
jgi:hypothetical protein